MKKLLVLLLLVFSLVSFSQTKIHEIKDPTGFPKYEFFRKIENKDTVNIIRYVNNSRQAFNPTEEIILDFNRKNLIKLEKELFKILNSKEIPAVEQLLVLSDKTYKVHRLDQHLPYNKAIFLYYSDHDYLVIIERDLKEIFKVILNK